MKLPRTPLAVVFDMDGLIFDTEALYQDAYMAAAKTGGHDLSLEVCQQTIGRTWVQARAILADHLGEDFAVEPFFTEMAEQFDRLTKTDLRLKPGVVELLDLLDELGLPRCIATSSAHSTVQSHLSAHGLVGRFHDVVGHGDYVDSKPAPEPFLKASERLGVERSLCLALEDSHNGVRSASAAGMIVLMVPDLVAPTKEIEALCTHVVTDLFVVADLLRQSS
jgi:HAD superfamily hydrolase (TIGR01509 family)